MAFADALIDEMACASLLRRLAGHLDRFEDEAALALLTDDCLWSGLTDAQGLDAIRARFASRPRAWRTMHLLSDTVVDIGGATAMARSNVVVHRFPSTGGPAPTDLPVTIGSYEDRLTRTPKGWRLAARTLHVIARRAP